MKHQQSVIRYHHSTKGMSLLEVILAIAVAGFVLAAAVSMLVSISTIWADRAERHFFVDHVDGVAEFLNATLANSGVKIALSDSNDPNNDEPQESDGDGRDRNDTEFINDTAPKDQTVAQGVPENEKDPKQKTTTNGGLVQSPEEPVTWARPPGFSESKPPLLNFKLTDAPALLVGLENAPLLGIDLFLYFEKDEGLSLLWYSILQEEAEDINDLRRTKISSLVTDIKYIYWDESFEKWEHEDEPMEGDGNDQYLLPRFIELTFEYEGETQKRTITIPVPSKSAFIF